MKLDIIRQIFEKYSNVKFNENTFSGSLNFYADGRSEKWTDRETDVNDKVNSRF